MTGRRRHQLQDEGGFTLIEVLVAAAILVVVGTSAVLVFGASSNSQYKMKVRQRQVAATEAAFARLRTDQSWTNRAACRAARNEATACSLTDLVADIPGLEDSELGVQLHATASGIGVDSTVDGTGGADSDGVLPDFYRVSVTVSGGGNSGTPPASVTVAATVNPNASASVGSLTVHVCGVYPQVDERMVISSCPEQRTVAVRQPAGDPGSQTVDWQAWRSAPAWARQTEVFPITRSRVRISAQSGKGGDHVVATDEHGVARFPNIAYGEYEIEVLDSVDGMEPWDTHSQPLGQAVVYAGSSARVIRAYQPRAAGALTVEATLATWDNEWEVPAAHEDNRLRMVPAPFGRGPVIVADRDFAIGAGTNGNAGRTQPISGTFVVDNPRPGLYIPYLATANSDVVLPLHNRQRYVWVNPDGRIIPLRPVADDFTKGFCDTPRVHQTPPGGDEFADSSTLTWTQLGPCTLPTVMWGAGGA